MLMRLILIGAAICLIAAFLGKRRLALWLLAGLSVAALALWGYESYQLSTQGGLFAENEVVVSEVELKASNYRPNLFELTGRIRNNSELTTLNGVLLSLALKDCDPVGECRELPSREQFVATKLSPESGAPFLEKIYLDKQALPQGELQVEYRIKTLRGHRPVW